MNRQQTVNYYYNNGNAGSVPLGVIFDLDFTSGAAFTKFGTFTTSQDSNGLTVSGGTGDFTKAILATGVTSLLGEESWDDEVHFVTPASIGASDYGLGFGSGVSTEATTKEISMARWGWENPSADRGKFTVYKEMSFSGQSIISPSPLNPTASTYYVAISKRRYQDYTLEIWNQAKDTLLKTYTQSRTLTAGDYTQPHNVNQHAIYVFGSSATIIKRWKRTINSNYRPKMFAVIDSNGQGSFAGSIANRYLSQFTNSKGWTEDQITLWGGFGATASVALSTTAVSNISSTYRPIELLYINIGSNDRADGTSVSTITARIQALITAFQSISSPPRKIAIGTPFPRTAVDMTSLSSALVTLVSSNPGTILVDMFNSALRSGPQSLAAASDSGDGIHGNLNAQTIAKNLMISAGL